MLTCIGGILFESIESKVDVFKVASVYSRLLANKIESNIRAEINEICIEDVEIK